MIFKKLLLLSTLFVTISVFSQIPNGYYDTATGSGYTLKTQLKAIISNGHIDQGYGALYNAYVTSDNDSFYENDNTVLDMYSENPAGADPYNYSHNGRTCGNYNSENDCYNREHIFPQGFFNSQVPMRTDIHHVVPSDGYVNGIRGSFPFGEVSNPDYTTNNGSKRGPNTFDTHSGTVFEPIDEFKGDIARMLLYFATRYEDVVTDATWDSHDASVNNPLNGTNDQVYEDWYIKLLYKWHTDDPVSQREITRNDAAYTFQGNRNPFIDHPEYVQTIWGSVLSVETFSSLEQVSIYPNPSTINKVTLRIPSSITIKRIKVYSILGKEIQSLNNPTLANNKLEISNLKQGIYLVKISNDQQNITKKIVVQ
ncbi:endonuclease [Flavobacteriaceae bacterium S356]|uniref:Endonuclease n=1 Tax=Asprobacillus argus TaxID=3076534 RepID=A0ABU3LG19_9FLAO|nr:endonuclease [Flavobacteriaceae bacterium S356]